MPLIETDVERVLRKINRRFVSLILDKKDLEAQTARYFAVRAIDIEYGMTRYEQLQTWLKVDPIVREGGVITKALAQGLLKDEPRKPREIVLTDDE